ncbi:MAG: hypothetical protein P4L36_19900 [Holophaga sp.]|nr:hypothetical protein [Holophaga sp.]
MADEVEFMALLPETDRIHFRNLALIRPQVPTEGQLLLVESLARTLSSPRLLALIARTPHWLVHGPVLQALAENEASPEPLRRDLEMAVSLFDLMRDLDRAPAEEKEERAETVKALYLQLPLDLRAIVKQQAKLLARSVNGSGQTMELPALPSGEQDWEALTALPGSPEPSGLPFRPSKQERLGRAEATPIPEDLQGFLQEADPDVRAAALRNPALSEEVLLAAFPWCAVPELFEEIYTEARWYFRDPLREAIYAAPCCPDTLAKRVANSRDLVALLEHAPLDGRLLHRIVCLFTQLDESEYQYLTLWAKRRAPNMLRVIKIFFDRLQRRRANQASGTGAGQSEGRWVSLKERVYMASQATQPEQLMAALRDEDPKVFNAVLENPGLKAPELIAAIPGLNGAQAEKVADHRLWKTVPRVCEALVHNVHLGPRTSLRLLQELRLPRILMDILRDQRIPHLEVKQLALEMLTAAYRAMTVPQRILALRASGGELLRHITQEILTDGETLRQLVADRQVDPGILLRLARNKQTPREILEVIAVHPVLMAHPAVMSELLLNPKTPRQASSRIWGLLSESEQQQLLRSPHLPAPLRHLA